MKDGAIFIAFRREPTHPKVEKSIIAFACKANCHQAAWALSNFQTEGWGKE